MKVIQNATSDTSSAFSEVSAGALVDDIIQTQMLYETILEASQNVEKRTTLSKDFVSGEEDRADMKAEIEKYRTESAEGRSAEEMAKILAITDALALILDIELEPIS